jgi:hypothetical protein
MALALQVELDVPDELGRLRLPSALDRRLQTLLDRQDQGDTLTHEERSEAEGLVNLAEFLSLLRLRAERRSRELEQAA